MSIPEVFFRETIDLNRYSNAVANKFVENYVQVIYDAAEQLVKLDIRQKAAPAGVVIAPQTRNRLRSIIAQSKASMDRWSKDTTKQMIRELEGLAKIQTGFIEGELQKAVKSGNIPINSVAVNQRYATSFVKTDPTKINIFTSKQFTEDDFIKFGSGKFELTARQGAMMTLPNGDTVEKAFRGIAARNQELLARTIRAGVFSGESTNQIARKLVGKLNFEDTLKAGGQAKLATHQIKTIVRTSVNQVQNQASQSVYAANSKVAPKYEYVATLDSKTSKICQRLDGQKFTYNKGPTPPQHFNCRSTTVPVVDYEGLSKRQGFEGLTEPPVGKVVSRPSATGRVPQGTQYGDWLLQQDKKLQVKTLGTDRKVNAFKKLAKKEGSGHSALRKIIRNDGTELPLDKLEKLYAKPSAVKKVTTKVAAPVAKAPKIRTSPAFSTEGVDTWLTKNKFGDIQEFTEDSLDSMESLGGLTEKNIKKMRLFMKKGNVVNQFNMKYEKTKNFTDLRQRFLTGENLKAFEKSNETVVKRFQYINKLDSKDLSSNTKDWKVIWNGRGNMGMGSQKDLFERNINLLKQGKMLDSSFQKRVVNNLFGNASGNANGYTIMNSGMVHTRLRDGARKITVSSAKKIKKSAAQTLETNFKFSKFKGSAYERYRQGIKEGVSEVWSNSHPMDASIDWFSTLVHEMGHQVHYQAGAGNLGRQFMKLKGMTFPTEYSRKNALEQFAESFTQYIFNPEGLQKNAPRLYNWVEQTLDQAIKNT
jgi:SPP1 gp7 family putative phage head morphogenesis protein